jgi:hypothetical protein
METATSLRVCRLRTSSLAARSWDAGAQHLMTNRCQVHHWIDRERAPFDGVFNMLSSDTGLDRNLLKTGKQKSAVLGRGRTFTTRTRAGFGLIKVAGSVRSGLLLRLHESIKCVCKCKFELSVSSCARNQISRDSRDRNRSIGGGC